ncbi:DMT family transporter [Clostridium butyricum]|uniref:DMT family transporter n=1 Tax=Clostridium butyricum TaxID=1492 RepID=UPI00374F142B
MKKLILILPILSGVLWGSAGVFVRILNDFGMDRYTILSSRMLIATAILLITMLIFARSSLKINLKDIWLFIGCGLLGILGLNFFYNEAVNQLTLSLAAILLSLAPVFVMFLSAIFFKEKITVKKVGCMFLAIIGCTLASGALESTSGLQWSASGILMGILSAFFCALYGIFSKVATNRGYSTSTIIFYSLLAITIVLIPFTDWNVFSAFLKEAPLTNTVFSILHSACTSILPYTFYSIALLHMENGKVSILAGGGEPMAAVIFGVLFFSEIPTLLNLFGLAITIVALSLLCMPPKKVEQI